MSNILKVAEIELIYRPSTSPAAQPKVTDSKEAVRILRQHWDINQINFVEEFKILLLNTANRVLGIVSISKGTTKATVVDIKLIFAAAIKANATGIILAHNHPSGNNTASQADISLTKRIRAAGEILDISVLDHIILTDTTYLSFNCEGI